MEIELRIHREPWIGTYLRVIVTLPTGETATADLSLTELEFALQTERERIDD